MPEDRVPHAPNWPMGPFLDFSEGTTTVVTATSVTAVVVDNNPDTELDSFPLETEELARHRLAETDRLPDRHDVAKERKDRKKAKKDKAKKAKKDKAEKAEKAEKPEEAAPEAPAAPAAPAGPAAPGAEAPPAPTGLNGAWQREKQRLAEGDKLALRRIAALKYGTGAAIGWAFNADAFIADQLDYAFADPGGAMSAVTSLAGAFAAWKVTGAARRFVQPAFSAVGQLFHGVTNLLSFIPVIGPIGNFVFNIYDTVFTRYFPLRVMLTGIGGLLAYPWGFAATGYAEAYGIDASAYVPHLIGITATGVLWYLIDRRTAHYEHVPGKVFHWLTCAATGTTALATALYSAS